MSLTYLPAVTRYDKKIIENSTHFLINPVWNPPTPEMLQGLEEYPNVCCDSAGYEIYQIMAGHSKTKRFFVIPGAGIKRNKDGLYLDPIDFCKKFGKLNVKTGFTIDYPLLNGTVEEEFKNHLHKSYENAQIMFNCRLKYCTGTELFIPLHFWYKDQLEDYYHSMSALEPDGYAFPVRDQTTWNYLMRIAFALTFLNSMGVKKVHLFGSSKAEIIIICAAALGLGMFERITFDSSTWRTDRNHIANTLDLDTLKQKDIRDLEQFRGRLPEDLAQSYLGHANNLSRRDLNKLIVLSNVEIIKSYTREMFELAKDIEELRWYAQKCQNLKPEIAMTANAIDLLQVGSLKGYRTVEEIYDFIWTV